MLDGKDTDKGDGEGERDVKDGGEKDDSRRQVCGWTGGRIRNDVERWFRLGVISPRQDQGDQ